MHPDDTIPEGFCQCGCGQRTRIWTRNRRDAGYVKGQPKRFINGHGRAKSVAFVVNPVTGCWDWQRTKDRNGYGQMEVNGKRRQAHVVFYERAYGPIPDGLEPDHVCENKGCVNADHLEPVTHAENTRRCKHTKLTASDVAAIRAAADTTTRAELARRFGVSAAQVSRIVLGQRW